MSSKEDSSISREGGGGSESGELIGHPVEQREGGRNRRRMMGRGIG